MVGTADECVIEELPGDVDRVKITLPPELIINDESESQILLLKVEEFLLHIAD